MTEIAQEKVGTRWGMARLVMVLLLAGMTQSLIVGLHEGAHAATCWLLGNEVLELTALHAACEPSDALATTTKWVAASGALLNLVLGVVAFVVLRAQSGLSAMWRWFLWLFMFGNWSMGLGYLIFSGLLGVGDFAVVIAGWEPALLWRWGMALVGAALWLGAVWLSLRVLGGIFGSSDPAEMRSRFLSLSIPSWIGAFVVIVLAAALNPLGIGGLPALAGMLAAAGTLSPLFWMPFWFVAPSFRKTPAPPLDVHFSTGWAVASVVVILVYVLLLGPGVRFGG